MDSFSPNDGRGRSVQDFVTGQKVFNELRSLGPIGLVVIDLVSDFASSPKDIDSDHKDSVSVIGSQSELTVKPLSYKQYTWEEPWDKTWKPFVTISRYFYDPTVGSLQLQDDLPAYQSSYTVIVQLKSVANEASNRLIELLNNDGKEVYVYQRESDDPKTDVVALLQRMWDELLPIYVNVEPDVFTGNTGVSSNKSFDWNVDTSYDSGRVVRLFNRLIQGVVERYNHEILLADKTCSVWLDLEDLLQNPVGYYPGAMELLYDTLVASSANWYGLRTYRIEELKVHVSGKLFLMDKSLDLASNQQWREDVTQEKPFDPTVDRDNLWILGCLILRFHGSDAVCDSLLMYLPDLMTKETRQLVIKAFPEIIVKIVSLADPESKAISPSVSCLVQICFQESLYFPEHDGYKNVIRFFQYVLNGCRWSKGREHLFDSTVMGFWGRTSTHRYGVGFRSLFYMRKNDGENSKKPLGQGAYGEVSRFLEEAESESQLFSANAAAKTSVKDRTSRLPEDYKNLSKLKPEKKLSESYLRELLQLKHPNIVEHLAIGQEITQSTNCVIPVRTTHIVMETYAGNLLDIIKTKSFELTDDVILRFMVQISCGVAFLHNWKCPIIAGDLKSENILLTECEDLTRAVTKISDLDGGAFRIDNPGQRARQRAAATADLFRNGISFVEELLNPMTALAQLINENDDAPTLIAKIQQVMDQIDTGSEESNDSWNAKAGIKRQLSFLIEGLQMFANSPMFSVLKKALTAVNTPSTPYVDIPPEKRQAVEKRLTQWIQDLQDSYSEHSNPNDVSSSTHEQQEGQQQEQQQQQQLVQAKEQQGTPLNFTHRDFSCRCAAPEVLEAGGIGQFDKSVDIWSMGCIFLELCCRGEFEFKSLRGEIFKESTCEDSANFQTKIAGVGNGGTPIIPKHLPEIFRNVLKMCIQRDEKERASACSIYEVLVPHLQHSADNDLPVSDFPYTNPYVAPDQGLRHLLDWTISMDFLSGRYEDFAMIIVSLLTEMCKDPIDRNSRGPDIIVASGICPQIIQLFGCDNEELVHEAVRLLWVIADKVPAHIEKLVMLNLLYELRICLSRFRMKLSVPIIACQMISTIAKKKKHFITGIFDAKLVPLLVHIMREGDDQACRGAALALSTIHKHGSDQHKRIIEDFGARTVSMVEEIDNVTLGLRGLEQRPSF